MSKVVDGLWLLSLEEDNYWDEIGKYPNAMLKVNCTDGVVRIHKRMLQWFWPLLGFVRKYGAHLSTSLFPSEEDRPTESVYEDLLSVNLKYTHEYIKAAVPLVEMAELGVDISRMLANGSRRIEHYSCALDASDYLELMRSPAVKDIRGRMLKTVQEVRTPREVSQGITKAYGEFGKYVAAEGLTYHRDNGLVQMICSETCRGVQLNQGIIAVGYASEVNSDFLPKPILTNYSQGLNSVYSYMANAASGAKSLMYSHAPMQDTEYLHRLVQQVSSCFNEVIYGDCGSTITYPLPVTKQNSKFLIGKYHLIDDVLHEVTADNHKSLVGQTLNARTVCGCKVPDKGSVCTACGGAVTTGIRQWASVGWTYTTRAYSGVSQSVLGVKHSDMTSVGAPVELAGELGNHITATEDTTGLRFVESGYQVGFKLKQGVVRLDEILSMSDDEFDAIDPWAFVNCFDLMVNHADGVTLEYEGPLLDRKEEMTLSKELLGWLRLNPEALTYVTLARRQLACWIDLTEYDKDRKVFTTKFAHYDMLKLFSSISEFIKGKVKSKAGADTYITDFNNFGQAVKKFWSIYAHKLPVNLCVLELSLYPFTVTDPENDDWSPYRGDGSCYFVPMGTLFDNRSLGARLGYETIQDILATPQASTITKRFSCHYDSFFVKA